MYIVPTGSTNSSVPEQIIDPSNPYAGQMWILDSGMVGQAGQAMGPMGITYARQEVQNYQFCIKMANGDIKRVRLV